MDFIVDEHAELLSQFQTSNLSVERTSTDTGTNSFGYDLIEFCKCNNLYILNGRAGHDKHIGRKTCKECQHC